MPAGNTDVRVDAVTPLARWGRAYYALLAIAGFTWGTAVFASPEVREATLGTLDPATVAVFDIPLFVVAAAAFGVLTMSGNSIRQPSFRVLRPGFGSDPVLSAPTIRRSWERHVRVHHQLGAAIPMLTGEQRGELAAQAEELRSILSSGGERGAIGS